MLIRHCVEKCCVEGLSIQHRGDCLLEALRTVVALALAVVAMRVSRWAFVSWVLPSAAPAALLPICRGLFLSWLGAAPIPTRVAAVSCVSAAAVSVVARGSLGPDCVQVAVGRPFERLLLLVDSFSLADRLLCLFEGEFGV